MFRSSDFIAGNKLAFAAMLLATCSFAQNNYNQPAPQGPPPGSTRQAQNPRPGAVNYVEGQVSSNGEPISLQSVGHFELQPNQPLQTGPNSYAEILLTPGAFLRVGPNTALRMTSVGLADCRIMLDHGSAMIEADQIIAGTHVEVTIGQTSVDLLKKGLYSFTTDPPSVETFEGKAEVVGTGKSRDVRKNDQLLFVGNPKLQATHFDVSAAKKEPLYVWSENRSREESEQTKRVAQNATAYMPVGDGWFWDPGLGYYGFWGPGFFNSPFGFRFYGGFYPGFYGGFYGYRARPFLRGPVRFGGIHGNGIAGMHGGWHAEGGFHHGGGGRR